jgi:hypothetical protein
VGVGGESAGAPLTLTRWHVGGPRADQALAEAGYWDT